MATALKMTHYEDDHLRRQGSRYWVLALITGIGWLLTLVTLAVYVHKPRERPYVITVNDKGEPTGMVEPLSGVSLLQHDTIVKFALYNFIRNARTVTPDIPQQKEHLYDAYAFASGQAYEELDAYYHDPQVERNPFKVAEKYWVQVSDIIVLPLPSQGTYQVTWQETRTGYHSPASTITQWRAAVKVIDEDDPSLDLRHGMDPEGERNPLGIYISTLEWAEEMAPTEGQG